MAQAHGRLEAGKTSGSHFSAPSAERRNAVSVGAASLAVSVLSWRDLAWRPVTAGVNSWQAGVTLAFLHHLQWGPQVVFTYGPYGFLEDILPFSHLSAALGLAYALCVTWSLAAMVILALRPSWHLLPAAVAAWAALVIASNLVEAPELATASALGLALASLRARSGAAHAAPAMGAAKGQWPPSERRRLALLCALGALAGFQLLVEVNVGLVTILLAVLAVAGMPGRPRAALAAGASFLTVLAAAELAAGQSLANLPSYLRGSLEVLVGYAPAMALSKGRTAEDWYAVVDVALLALVFALALRRRPGPERAVVTLALAGWVWEALKEGFVRHDKHDLVFFSLVLVALCLARLPRPPYVQAGAIAVAALFACLANGGPPVAMRSPVEDVKALAQEVTDLAVPGRWGAIEHRARAETVASGDALPPGLVRSLQGGSVAGEPLEDALTFAHPGLRWGPLPVLQGYSAYTTYLDQLDASFIASARAPEHILYSALTIDGRDPAWDPPGTTESLYCHYAAIGRAGGWLVLARVLDRCGRPQLLSEETAHFGQLVHTPLDPARMVVATFSLTSPFSSRLEGAVLKPPEVEVTLDGERYRFITGTAGDDHVLSTPASLGYPAKWAPRPAHELELTGDGWAVGHGEVKVSFYSVPLSPR